MSWNKLKSMIFYQNKNTLEVECYLLDFKLTLLIDSSVKVKNKNFEEVKLKTYKCIEKTYKPWKKYEVYYTLFFILNKRYCEDCKKKLPNNNNNNNNNRIIQF